MYCIKCGSKINENDVFCANCGTKIEKQNENEVYKTKGKDKFGIVLLLIILGIFALIIGSNIIVSNKAKDMGKNVKYYENMGVFNKYQKNTK